MERTQQLDNSINVAHEAINNKLYGEQNKVIK